jgi:hypothetical protein
MQRNHKSSFATATRAMHVTFSFLLLCALVGMAFGAKAESRDQVRHRGSRTGRKVASNHAGSSTARRMVAASRPIHSYVSNLNARRTKRKGVPEMSYRRSLTTRSSVV